MCIIDKYNIRILCHEKKHHYHNKPKNMKNNYKNIQKKQRWQSRHIYLAFNYYQTCSKICLEYLVLVFNKQKKVNKMNFYFKKVYFLT